jgi:hypothetical protein
MSTYVKYNVLRVPFDACNLGDSKDYDDFEFDLLEKYPRLKDKFDYAEVGKFMTCFTSNDLYIDFVLDYDYDANGEYGKVRELYPSEIEKFMPIFKLIDEDIDMSKVRYVEYCYYNCCEPDDYYDTTKDEFYNELPGPNPSWYTFK